MTDFTIKKIVAREVIDSRGNPTVEADVFTGSGFGRASVPSGASTGAHEALELRDGDKRYMGKGVLKACKNVNEVIAPAIVGMDSRNQREIDEKMISMDGTENKSKLGANAILAVSLAVAKAAANTSGLPLFRHLNPSSSVIPVPLMNIINGGKHAGGNLSIQEFMIIPGGVPSFKEAIRVGCEIYQQLKKHLRNRYGPFAVNIGDEGGFAPPLSCTREALDAIEISMNQLGYSKKEVRLGIDAAATSFYSEGSYLIDGEELSPGELIDFYSELVSDFPIILLEDPFHEEDYDSLVEITKKLGKKVQVVGDDIFVTNIKRFRRGVEMGAANAILLKVNQIGTLTEALDVAKYAFNNNYGVVVSHRSGETEDNYIADIAVALGAGKIKTGAPARGERVAKYNQLIRIEEMLGPEAKYPGFEAFRTK
jgi:enolase